ncbi:Hypothetical protein HDN1F_33090 [gamma proteobacterium HdN1]|nr:Hypothetical protein HDN1F_33090 [gamma proteobacterium HdN1]
MERQDHPASSDNRRDYFRLEDKIHLVKKPIPKHLVSDDPYHERYQIPRSTLLLNQLRSMDADYHQMIHQLADSNHALYSVLTALDRKVDLLAKYITNPAEGDSAMLRETVELSERGMAFYTMYPLEEGDYVHLTMVLFPTAISLATIAEVRSCHQVETHPAIYRIGSEFIVLMEADRKQLSKHLLRKQAMIRRGDDVP